LLYLDEEEEETSYNQENVLCEITEEDLEVQCSDESGIIHIEFSEKILYLITSHRLMMPLMCLKNGWVFLVQN